MDRALESNRIFLDAWDVMNQDAPGFASLRGGLFEASFCGVASPFFNLVIAARRPESLDEFAASFKELHRCTAAQQVPWILTLCHEIFGELMPGAELIFERRRDWADDAADRHGGYWTKAG